MDSSPILGVYKSNATYISMRPDPEIKIYGANDILEERYVPNMRTMSMHMDRVSWLDGVHVKDMAVAENRVINQIQPTCLDLRSFPGAFTDPYQRLPLEINRSANLIAVRTRRACGNVALIGVDVYMMLMRHAGGGFNYKPRAPRIGRWDEIGVVNSTITMYVGEHIESDEIVVCYVGKPYGAIDGVGGVLMHGDQGYLVSRDSIAGSTASHDYMVRHKVLV